MSKQLEHFHKDFNDSFTAIPDLYDRMVALTHEVDVTHRLQSGLYSHRYLKSLRSLLSSSSYLISPRTRFSLFWRVTVTNCLLLEIGRLCASRYLFGTFTMSLTQILSLLVECKEPEQPKLVSSLIKNFRQLVFDILPLVGSSPVDLAACIPSGPQATVVLLFSQLLEKSIDAIAFFDIIVWFLTGDIDIDTHEIIPKPFFARCILPGTLVQVLDHPTLPELAPTLVSLACYQFYSCSF